MRLIKQNIERKDGSGTATLLPEEPEDMVSESVFFPGKPQSGDVGLIGELL